MLASSALRTGIINGLTNNADFTHAVPGGVFDAEPPPEIETTFPYCVVDSFIESNRNQLSTINRDVTFLVHIFSQYYGSAESDDIADIAVSLFEQIPFPVVGWGISKILFINAMAFVQPDHIRHTTVRYRVSLTKF